MAFSAEAYRALVGAFFAAGYQARGFTDVEPNAKHVIFRHDVDMSLSYAVEMAKLEHELGIQAHYFVLVTTDLYNILSSRSREALREIEALGHLVGLHFDAALGDTALAALNERAAAECALLESVLDQKVEAVSFHRPAPALRGLDAPIAGRLHAYQSRFFDDIGYCSDSRGQWHHGPPTSQPAFTDGRALQLLTHPIWWFSPGDDPISSLQDFLARQANECRGDLADNCEPFREYVRGRAEQP